jgi:hypothetical protein
MDIGNKSIIRVIRVIRGLNCVFKVNTNYLKIWTLGRDGQPWPSVFSGAPRGRAYLNPFTRESNTNRPLLLHEWREPVSTGGNRVNGGFWMEAPLPPFLLFNG